MSVVDLPLYPDSLPIGHYRIHLRALETVELSALPITTLRGALGWVFKKMVCYQPKVKTCAGCLLRAQCPYPQLFEPIPPKNTMYADLQNVPAPYVLRLPQDNRRTYTTGEVIVFEVILFGSAISFLPYLVVALQKLHSDGLGSARGRVALSAVEALRPDGSVEKRLFSSEQPEVIQSHNGWHSDKWIAGGSAPNQVTIEFLTPIRIKDGRIQQSTPTFQGLFRALLRRISALNTCYGDLGWETDFVTLVELSGEIELLTSIAEPVRPRRYSTRQRRTIELWASIGQATYGGEMSSFWPLLQLGQATNVGKSTTLGFGQYRLLG